MREDAAGLRQWLLLAAGVTVVAVLCTAAILLMNTRVDETSRGSTPQEAAGGLPSSGAPAEEHSTMDGSTILTEEEALT